MSEVAFPASQTEAKRSKVYGEIGAQGKQRGYSTMLLWCTNRYGALKALYVHEGKQGEPHQQHFTLKRNMEL